MCGIAGIYNKHGIPEDRTVIERMSLAIEHRGPDEEGFHLDNHVHLASRRLSIIDLSAGEQPIYNKDQSRCIVYNGEIYNYRNLKKELSSRGHVFKTNTDTEVVLLAYEEWGEKCLNRFKGMFSICIWDLRKKELFLARDRLGIKPFYFADLKNGTFVFASEIKAILKHPEVKKAIYPNAINNLLTYGFNVAPHTFFDGIKQLLPGFFLKIRPDNFELKQYWDIDLKSPMLNETKEDIALMLKDKIEDTVKSSLVSDVPVASYLSGGIDSSTISGFYSNLSDSAIKTITITFDDAGYDESEYSKKVSEHFNTENIEFKCSIKPDDIKNLIYYLENPQVSLLNLPLFLLSKKTREQGIKVVLSGDGADEILGGYDYFKLLKTMTFIDKTGTPCRKNLLRKIFPHLKTSHDAEAQYIYLKNISNRYPVSFPGIPYQFQEFQFKNQLFSNEYTAKTETHRPDNPFFFDLEQLSQKPLIDQALYLETKMRLLNLTLPLSDKMSMANSVENRPLFLDHELVEFCFRIPHHYKIQGLSEKNILKKSMENMLPKEICQRKKQPLQPPGNWFIDSAGEMLRDLLSYENIKKTGYFNPAFVDHLLTEYNKKATVDYSGAIVVIFFIQLWHDIFIANN